MGWGKMPALAPLYDLHAPALKVRQVVSLHCTNESFIFFVSARGEGKGRAINEFFFIIVTNKARGGGVRPYGTAIKKITFFAASLINRWYVSWYTHTYQ